jgi:hypothetical protein
MMQQVKEGVKMLRRLSILATGPSSHDACKVGASDCVGVGVYLDCGMSIL